MREELRESVVLFGIFDNKQLFVQLLLSLVLVFTLGLKWAIINVCLASYR